MIGVSRGDAENYRRDAVIDAARALAARLEAIEADGSFKGIWGFLHVHNYTYSGPNWKDQLAELTSAIVNLDREGHSENP